MSILKDISELLRAGVIDRETAEKIQKYYDTKSNSSPNRLFIVFGILGAVLVGLGIILIVAHNWDELSKGAKTFFSFLPLLTAQILCAYALTKKQESIAWKESASAYLFFAVGASIALISQIYNLPDNTARFLLTWMLLCLPLIYIMNSSITSLLYICGITYYATDLGYFSFFQGHSDNPYLYWLLLFGVLPHYYNLYRKKPLSNFMIFHNWLLPLSIIISLGTVAKNTEELLFIAYLSLFGLFYSLGNLEFFLQQRTINNSYKILGSLGTISLLLALSFDWFWQDLRTENFKFNEAMSSPEFFASLILSLLAGLVFYFYAKNKTLTKIKPLAPIFILFILTFIIGLSSPAAVVLINLFIFAVGLLTIRNGAIQDHLGILNFGLLIITAVVICRFFDSELSFVIRGLMFLTVGAGFFIANFYTIKKRKTNEQ